LPALPDEDLRQLAELFGHLSVFSGN
jgi:hypothetical protein